MENRADQENRVKKWAEMQKQIFLTLHSNYKVHKSVNSMDSEKQSTSKK